jgi:hypothetical protein
MPECVKQGPSGLVSGLAVGFAVASIRVVRSSSHVICPLVPGAGDAGRWTKPSSIQPPRWSG